MFREGNRVRKGSVEPGVAEGAVGLSWRLRGDLLALRKSLTGRVWALVPGNKGQDKQRQPQVSPGRFTLDIGKTSSWKELSSLDTAAQSSIGVTITGGI